MARSRSPSRNDVVADSEEEKEKQSKGNEEDKHSGDERMEDDENGTGNSDDDEEEYEIEAILDAEMGMFNPTEWAYFVHWKGYPDSENSWVSQNDAGNAMQLIQEFWKARPKKSQGAKSPSSGKKRTSITKRESSVKKETSGSRARKSSNRYPSEDSDIQIIEKAPPKLSSTKRRFAVDSSRADSDDDDSRPLKKSKTNGKHHASGRVPKVEKDEGESDAYGGTAAEDDEAIVLPNMEAYMHESNWEQLVEQVDTVEQEGDGTLRVYLTLDDGKRASHDSAVVRQRCPQKLITFYESHLRWKPPHA
ncbi:hypothetical protein DACRYDRAFT_120002 [Dacryopinax primogenitus]|uniref:Chromo domain-containing protein n=1 Tax=Dacryopinax primogenitus (strain DJM 731) TaxID=1858805 RepID=M5FMZ8_DACPD|nr:uncharacterized protein DACRYDRAFT_120002 [Dacryopinax primogenitus]EJT96570.1 hypothetical protein DACRYDRAFT_120002 [Dacryopinax primogenitus]